MLTPLHFIYLAVIVVVIVLMIMKHDVVAPVSWASLFWVPPSAAV